MPRELMVFRDLGGRILDGELCPCCKQPQRGHTLTNKQTSSRKCFYCRMHCTYDGLSQEKFRHLGR